MLFPIVGFILLTLCYVWNTYSEPILIFMLSILTIIFGGLILLYSIEILEDN